MFNNEDFENGANGATSLFSTIVGFAIRAFLAVTTAGFFYIYGGDIWSWILPYPMANFMASLTGVILVDGLAFAWTYLRRSSADTEEQQNYAKVGAWLDMGLSLTVTGVFIILTTPLLAQSVSAEVLGVLLNLASWLGIIVGVVAFGGNGIIWHFYDNASSGSVKQLQVNQLRAFARKMEHALEMDRLKMQASKTFQQIQEALPQYTDGAAQQSRDGYLASRFAQIDTNNDGVLSFDEIEQAALDAPPSQPIREYSRADRDERLAMSVETDPAPPTITRRGSVSGYTPDEALAAIEQNMSGISLDEGSPFTVSIEKDGQWFLRKSGILSLYGARSEAVEYWNRANGQHSVKVESKSGETVYGKKNTRSESGTSAPLS